MAGGWYVRPGLCSSNGDGAGLEVEVGDGMRDVESWWRWKRIFKSGQIGSC